jgi:deoxycytidylate deaminase
VLHATERIMRGSAKEDVFDKALALAKKSTMTQRHGAVIVKNGEVIGQGYNHIASYMSHSWSCHAEIAAIMSLKTRTKKFLEDATLVVVRIGPESQGCPFKLSKPCAKCQEQIEKTGIKRIFFSV